MPEQSPFDVLEELKWIVADLKRALWGDTNLRTPGMFNELDALRKKVDQIQIDVQELKERQGRPGMWLAGILCFCAAIIFGCIAVYNGVFGDGISRVPADIAGWIAAGFGVTALYLLTSGHGWIGRD